jgi:hypothetical protein
MFYCPLTVLYLLHCLSCIGISVGVQRTLCNNTVMVQLVSGISFTGSIIQQNGSLCNSVATSNIRLSINSIVTSDIRFWITSTLGR